VPVGIKGGVSRRSEGPGGDGDLLAEGDERFAPGAPLLVLWLFPRKYARSSRSTRMSTMAPTKAATRLAAGRRRACAGPGGPDIYSSLHRDY
jgi:hypothetical protein